MCMDRKERIYLFWIGLYPLVNMPSSWLHHSSKSNIKRFATSIKIPLP
jgi:hypothetical protein